MNVLSGTVTADSGTVLLDGRPVMINNPRAAQQLGIGIVHQELNLMPHLTVAQNIFIGREPRVAGLFTSERQLVDRTARLLRECEIVLDPRANVGALTVAQQQMVEIAKAMSFPATRVLIMDEPTSALSTAETEVLFGLIRGLTERGVGIIYISHRMEELRRIADRVTILRDGRHVADHAMTEVDDGAIIAEMVGREIAPAGRPEQPARSDQGGREPAGLEAAGVAATGPESAGLEVVGLSTPRLLRDVSFSVRCG